MSTTTFVKVQENPEIPLLPDVLMAYKALYDQYEDAIQNTADTTLLEKLNASQLQVAAVIVANNQAILDGDTDAYGKVLTQIGVANKGIADLQAEIAKIAGNIKLYAGILAAIDKVLTMVPGI